MKNVYCPGVIDPWRQFRSCGGAALIGLLLLGSLDGGQARAADPAVLARHGYERIERYVPFDQTNRYYRKSPQEPSP